VFVCVYLVFGLFSGFNVACKIMSFLIFISYGFCSFWFLGLKRTSICS
jgi:hypothetical protein